ncbi:glycine betaine/L-proline ABC transporter substrate-binding protein ProX [Oceanidesulfovibrio indonesiensis]|nr:glycine betaine/L-proline ABC transporter substrate-binding protein ProX [Oceanidesulfovibrio indonesiensis]
MKNRILAIMLTLAMVLGLAGTAVAAGKPGEGKSVTPGRATWTTGFFQEAIFSRALKELGYDVKKAKDLSNPIFYQAVTQGDVDYWANGWFPLHYAQLPDNFDEKAERVGYVAKAGGLSGYLVSKDAVEEFNIQSLDDFKREEVKKAFDANGDGKADLVACPPGWGCEKVISHHLAVYGLKDHVNAIQASYPAAMADAIARFNNGEPVFFYTWAPNWTIFKLKPGEDVLWMNVPEIIPSEAQEGFEEQLTMSGVEGAVSDPVKMGFVANDIQVVANKEFLAENPAARKLFEIMSIPLFDIAEQNTRMFDGEDSQRDIERHVDEWIEANQEAWNGWIAEAAKAAK